MTSNGYPGASQQQQQSQSQSPVSFKSSIEPFSALISRQHSKTSPLTNNTNTSAAPATISQSGSTITDQYGLVGLLQMIQQAEQKPDASIFLNFDLTTLGLSKRASCPFVRRKVLFLFQVWRAAMISIRRFSRRSPIIKRDRTKSIIKCRRSIKWEFKFETNYLK